MRRRVIEKSIVFLSLTWALQAQALPNPSPESKPKAVLQEIKLIDDVHRFIYPARVEAKINSTMTADLDGHVLRILKTLGSPVRAGEVVLFLENRDPAFTYSAVPVRSPITGTISQLNLQLMSKVAKGEKLFTVMNADVLSLTAEIPSSDMAFLKPGLEGKFHLSTANTEPLNIRLIGLSPIIDPRTGTATAELEFPLKTKQATPPVGSVGQVYFQLVSGQLIFLPENAISYVEGKPTVKVIDQENKAHRRLIELGEQREDLYVVKSGLQPGEKVAIRSDRSLKDGEIVEPQSSEKSEKGAQ